VVEAPVDERALAGAGHTRHDREHAERDVDVDVLEVVGVGAADLERKSNLKSKNLQQYVHLYLKEFLPFWEKPGWGDTPPPCSKFCPKSDNEKAYTEFPKLLNSKFDIVIIDARFRRHCIKTANKVLAPGGVVIMHDAHKLHYHVGLDDYRFSMFLQSGKWYPLQEKSNMLWIGSNEDSKAIHEVKKFALKNN